MTARSAGWLCLVAGIALIGGLVAAGARRDEERASVQSPGPIPAPVAPAVRMLADGLTLVVVPQPRVPRVSMALVFPRDGPDASVAAVKTAATATAGAGVEGATNGAGTAPAGPPSKAGEDDAAAGTGAGIAGDVTAVGDSIVDVAPVLRALLNERGALAADGLRAAAFRLGGELAVRAEPDSVALTLSVPANDMGRGLALLARVVRVPTAGSSQMERLAAAIGQATAGAPLLPAGRGPQALWQTVFRVPSIAVDESRVPGADARASSVPGGDRGTVPRSDATNGDDRLRPGDGHPGSARPGDVRVRAVYARVLRPDVATLIVTGATDETSVAQAVLDAFGGWGAEANRIRSSGVPARPLVPAKHVVRASLSASADATSEAGRGRAVSDAGAVRILLIDRPGSVQASLWFGSAVPDVAGVAVAHESLAAAGDADAEVSVARQAAQRAAMEMANALCAASPSGRVFRRLVEEEGISYGPYSRVTPVRGALFFTLSVDAGNPVAARALEETLQVLRALRETMATPREIEAARRFVQGQALLRVSSQASIVSELAMLVGTGGDARRLGAVAQAAQTIRAADVQASARQLWDPARLAVVVIGDANELTPSLSQIGRVERFVP